jgi:hypothetical protein
MLCLTKLEINCGPVLRTDCVLNQLFFCALHVETNIRVEIQPLEKNSEIHSMEFAIASLLSTVYPYY